MVYNVTCQAAELLPEQPFDVLHRVERLLIIRVDNVVRLRLPTITRQPFEGLAFRTTPKYISMAKHHWEGGFCGVDQSVYI